MTHLALVTQLSADGTSLVSTDSRAIAQHPDLLAAHDLTLTDAAWEDSAVDWGAFDALVIKSTWNYHLPENAAAFNRWLDSVSGLNLYNPPSVLRWNSDKIYLRELEAAGVPVVPSVWREAGTPLDVQAAMAAQGWDEVVIKPRTGASAFGVLTAKSPEEAAAADSRSAEYAVNGAVIQPLLGENRTDGEWSFLFFRDGERLAYSHAAIKRPAAGKITVQSGTSEVVAPPDELLAQAGDIARLSEDCIGAPLLYARVDAVARDGRLLLMELELLEPSLFLHEAADRGPVERYVRAIASVVG
jgi:glutathione synthase/RimK-type ligase-like ATP-grasp enzyme